MFSKNNNINKKYNPYIGLNRNLNNRKNQFNIESDRSCFKDNNDKKKDKKNKEELSLSKNSILLIYKKLIIHL